MGGAPRTKILSGVFWTKFEPILNKIPMPTSDCRPAGDNPAQRFRTASASLPPSKTEKFSKHFFNRAPAKFFQLRKRKFFYFDILLTQNCGNASHPPVPLRGRAVLLFIKIYLRKLLFQLYYTT